LGRHNSIVSRFEFVDAINAFDLLVLIFVVKLASGGNFAKPDVELFFLLGSKRIEKILANAFSVRITEEPNFSPVSFDGKRLVVKIIQSVYL
jgi:hypothetical protein